MRAATGAKSLFITESIRPSTALFGQRSRCGLLFLSKTELEREKSQGCDEDLFAGRARLTIAGGRRPLESKVSGTLSRRGLEWAGPVAGTRKAELLSQARALIFSGALGRTFWSCRGRGADVGYAGAGIATGKLARARDPGSGRAVGKPRDTRSSPRAAWVEKVRALIVSDPAPRWSAEVCRARAVEHFHYLKMAEGYENAYKRVVSREKTSRDSPMT